MKNKPFILSIGLISTLGCLRPAEFSSYNLKPQNGLIQYKGESENLEYSVEGREIIINGACVERTITITGRGGLNINPNHVDYVWVRDQKCDELFEDWRFRDKRRTMTKELAEDINHIFQAVKFRSESKKANSS